MEKNKQKNIIIIFNSFTHLYDVMRISLLFEYGDREVQLVKFIIISSD